MSAVPLSVRFLAIPLLMADWPYLLGAAQAQALRRIWRKASMTVATSSHSRVVTLGSHRSVPSVRPRKWFPWKTAAGQLVLTSLTHQEPLRGCAGVWLYTITCTVYVVYIVIPMIMRSLPLAWSD